MIDLDRFWVVKPIDEDFWNKVNTVVGILALMYYFFAGIFVGMLVYGKMI